MSGLLQHLIVAPIALPLIAAVALLLLGEKRLSKMWVNLGASLAGLVVAVAILWRVDQGAGAGDIEVYLAANWQAPFGIVLVADRLSAMMLVLVGIVGLCAALYAEAAWARAGVHFHSLFQIQLLGLNGAFLTGDLFNLFVFFEVMLAASYGLQLHGSGWLRVRSGLHYIAVNLLASSLFLIGLSVLYGILGTLNMADMAGKIALVPDTDRGLLHAGAAILAMAFLVKAAIWPLNSWLVPAYAAASAPAAAIFTLMSKVGLYALLRLWTLFFGSDAGHSLHFGQSVLLYGGLATIVYGTVGLMASLRVARVAAYSIVVSSGTLLAALGMGSVAVTSAALFYLTSATLSASALFLLAQPVERIGAAHRRGLPGVDIVPGDDTNLDDEEMPLVGRSFRISLALLGLAFMACAAVVAGLPPLSGFIAKLAVLSAVIGAEGMRDPSPAGWMLMGLMLVSGLVATISLTRIGIRHIWSGEGGTEPQLKRAEGAGAIALLLCCVALTLKAETVMRYASLASVALHAPAAYIDAVLSARPQPGLPPSSGFEGGAGP